MNQYKRIYKFFELELKNFFKSGGGCFAHCRGFSKNVVLFTDQLNDYDKHDRVSIYGYYEVNNNQDKKEWNDYPILTLETDITYGLSWYFNIHNISGFSTGDSANIYGFCKHSGAQHNPLKRMISDYTIIEKMDFLSDAQKETLMNHFGQYKITKYLEQVFPMIKDKKYNDKPLADGLFHKYGLDVIDIIKSDPYEIYYDVDFRAYNFKLAEDIFFYLNLPFDDEKRIHAVIYQGFKELMNDNRFRGDTAINFKNAYNNLCWHVWNLFTKGQVFNNSEKRKYGQILSSRINNFEDRRYGITRVDDADYIIQKGLLNYEYDTAQFVKWARKAKPLFSISTNKIEKDIEEFESIEGIVFTNEQKEAIQCALTNRLSIITGGPGCGKTKITQAILYIVQKNYNVSPVVTSYTGKAMKRACDVIKECKVPIDFHHATLLSYYYQQDETNGVKELGKLRNRFIILDEMSMVSQEVFGMFLSLLDNCQLVLIGDENQLPSIDRGQVFKDLIDSEKIETRALTKNLRLQNADKEERITILWNYQAILDGDYDKIQSLPEKFEWQGLYDKGLKSQLVVKHYIDYVKGLNGREQVDIKDVCILAPVRKSQYNLGVVNINLEVQEKLNPDGQKTFRWYGGKSGSWIRVGDRVIITQNNSTEDYCNGDVGTVTAFHSGFIWVTLDDGIIHSFNYEESVVLELAYAMTVHKSQGSEYKIVLFLFDEKLIYSMGLDFLNKNLIYTGVTRSKDSLLLYGNKQIMDMGMTKNMKERKTLLPEYLKEI